MTVFHKLGTHSGKELDIKGYGLYILTALYGLVDLELDGLQQLGDGAAVIVYVPWGEDSVQL